MEYTSIKISNKTKEVLKKLKIHPRQPYEEVISMLIKSYKEVKNEK